MRLQLVIAAVLALAACQKESKVESVAPAPPGLVGSGEAIPAAEDEFGAIYALTEALESRESCEADALAPSEPGPAALFVLEPIFNVFENALQLWYYECTSEGACGEERPVGEWIFYEKDEATWSGVPSKSIGPNYKLDPFGSFDDCSLSYTENTAKLDGETLTMELKVYRGTVPMQDGSCTGGNILYDRYDAHRGKLDCVETKRIVAQRVAPLPAEEP